MQAVHYCTSQNSILGDIDDCPSQDYGIYNNNGGESVVLEIAYNIWVYCT